jgi:hypothetical protein
MWVLVAKLKKGQVIDQDDVDAKPNGSWFMAVEGIMTETIIESAKPFSIAVCLCVLVCTSVNPCIYIGCK